MHSGVRVGRECGAVRVQEASAVCDPLLDLFTNKKDEMHETKVIVHEQQQTALPTIESPKSEACSAETTFGFGGGATRLDPTPFPLKRSSIPRNPASLSEAVAPSGGTHTAIFHQRKMKAQLHSTCSICTKVLK